MARAKASIEDSVSLFPFLSILAAVIGILVLMITAITLGQIGKDNPQATADAEAAAEAAAEAKARAEKFKQLRDQAKADQEKLAELKIQVSKVQAAAQDAAIMAANIAEAKKEAAALQASVVSNAEMATQREIALNVQQQRLDQLLQENAALEERLKPLLAQLEKLKAEVAKLKEPPEEAQVQIKPSGSGSDLKPVFVECSAGSIVLHDRPDPLRIPAAQMAGHAEFTKLLEQVKRTPKTTVVFLIRPDGVGTYNAARNIARGRLVSNGKLAIGSQGNLDLSLFTSN